MKVTIALLTGVLTIFVLLPIWFSLIYQILNKIDATDLMWYLFYSYVPVAILIAVFGVFLKAISDD